MASPRHRRRLRIAPTLAAALFLLAGAARPGSPAATRTTVTAKSAGSWSWSSVKASGVTVRYAVALPPGLRPGETRNVLLAFPPGNQTANLVEVGMRSYWATEGTRRGWVVISPAAPGPLFFEGSAKLIEPFRAAVMKDLAVTPGEVALAGISNGGLSAFRAALDHPERFSALVTLPGAPPGGNDPNEVARLRNLRIGLWVGGDDRSWRASSQFVYDTLAGLSSTRVDIALHVLPGQGHILSGVRAADVWDVIAPPTR